MVIEEKLKQVIEELKRKAEEWNQECDDTMIEKMKKDIIEIFKKYRFEELKTSDEAIYELYKKTDRGFEQVFNYKKLEDLGIIVSVEGIIEFLERNNFKYFMEVDGFNIDDIWYDTYLIYYKDDAVIVVREHTIYVGRGDSIKFYDFVGAFKIKG